MKEVSNVASIDANVTEGITSQKTKTLTELNALSAKKTFIKKQGDLTKVVLIGKGGKANNIELTPSSPKRDILKTKLATATEVAPVMVTNATPLEEQINTMSIMMESLMKIIEE